MSAPIQRCRQKVLFGRIYRVDRKHSGNETEIRINSTTTTTLSAFQMMFGLIFGLTMPLFIPKVLLYEAGEKQNEIGEVIH